MVTVAEALALGVIILLHTAVAALLTRFLRVRLNTRWGSSVYVALFVPVVLLASTLLFGSLFGPDLGSPTAVVGATVILPMTLGVSFDYFWMPAPEEVDLPDRSDRGSVRRDS